MTSRLLFSFRFRRVLGGSGLVEICGLQRPTACFTLALLSCQTCCKLADLQCKFEASLMPTKITIWVDKPRIRTRGISLPKPVVLTTQPARL
ncbi:hypothetical protein AVEN_254061-1 [Araneus ventricosus]|uniref:Uncharacterized protein n=1 Tax=Araneus ventricosus TaxID=182803 RepID=A0A4Y2BYM1_ARAVE|nr:hypothetical protein AVEN_254061-1 [Araneus ventricosus]